jgi:hypothetical protein
MLQSVKLCGTFGFSYGEANVDKTQLAALKEMVAYEERRMRFELQMAMFTDSGCYEWTGVRYKTGYGQFWWGKDEKGRYRNMKASRAAWLIYNGPITDGLFVLHKCHNRACVNTNHLYLGTHQKNMKDRDEAGHTSKGSHRYNWKRSTDLISKIMAEVQSGKQLQEVCYTLGIGWQTLYRARAQSPELKQLMADTKSARYTKGGKKAWEARGG